jgi:predicted dehydrogenase
MGKLRMAMVGGGPGAFIGPVHRMAAELDGEITLVAGAFSSDPERSAEAGRRYGLDLARAYASYQDMISAERARPDGAQLIAIVTPNHLHLPVAKAALEAGLAVISDKPATATLAEALDLREVLARTGGAYALTFTYTGYPMLREARAIVAAGRLGQVRKAVVEYPQGWLSGAAEAGNKQAAWRVDPNQAGHGGAIGDIGVHAFNALEFVSGREVVSLCAQLSAVLPGRRLDDDCNVLLELDNGARGLLTASQVSAGERNGLRLRVHGEHGGLDWSHDRPNELVLNWLDQPSQTLHAGSPYLSEAARGSTRLPSGHPEGFIEAFANIYRDMAALVRGEPAPNALQGIEAGVRSMAFIERAVESSRSRRWVEFSEEVRA